MAIGRGGTGEPAYGAGAAAGLTATGFAVFARAGLGAPMGAATGAVAGADSAWMAVAVFTAEADVVFRGAAFFSAALVAGLVDATGTAGAAATLRAGAAAAFATARGRMGGVGAGNVRAAWAVVPFAALAGGAFVAAFALAADGLADGLADIWAGFGAGLPALTDGLAAPTAFVGVRVGRAGAGDAFMRDTSFS